MRGIDPPPCEADRFDFSDCSPCDVGRFVCEKAADERSVNADTCENVCRFWREFCECR